MRPSSEGLLPRAAQPQVGLRLQSLRQRTLEGDVGRSCRSARRSACSASSPVWADGVRTGSADFARIELKSERGLKPVRSTVMRPESVLLSLVPVRFSEALATVLKSSG